MTIYRQAYESDTWKVHEVHVGKMTDSDWCVQAKLLNGRVPLMFIHGPQPKQEDEPELLKQLISKDRKDQRKEWGKDLWQKLTRCYCCRCDDS